MSERIEKMVVAMNIQPNDRVLEIGCGHGIAATLICRMLSGGSYLGVDRSRKMVAAAANRNTNYVSAGVAGFVVGRLEDLDLGQARFDKILAMRVRIFHDQPDEARRLAQRWLAPPGELFVEYDQPR